MKIYQLHEYSGVWEDFRDSIIGSYLRKERAEEECKKAKAREKSLIERHNRCASCPLLDEDFKNINEILSEYPNYCKEPKLEETDYGIDCLNAYIHWDEATFEIQEVEVEE